jgi:hypothetical protein
MIGKPLPAYWARAYGPVVYPGTWTNFSAVQELPDGGLLLAGQHEFDRWLVRVAADGNIVWQKILQELGPHTNPSYPVGLSAADGGGVVLASIIEEYDYARERWDWDVVVLEVDDSGQLLWQKRYLTGQSSEYVGIGATDDGYFVVEQNVPQVLKIDKGGAIVWQRSYRDEGFYNQITAMAVTSDGGLLLAGLNGRSSGLWVLKIDGGGGLVWQKAFIEPEGAWDCEPSWIEETADQGIIVSGTSYEPQEPGGCLVSLTTGGDLDWARGYALTIGDSFDSVRETADGGYVVGGKVRPDPGNYRSDALLLRLDGSGDVLWAKQYGGSGEDSAYAVSPTDSGFLLVGRTNSASSFELGGLVLRVDGSGDIGGCDLVHARTVTTTDHSLVASDTMAQASTTSVTVEDADLVTMDSQAVMVQLCPSDLATMPGGCDP